MQVARSEAGPSSATPSSSSVPLPQARSRFSCLGCRRRKQRCDKLLPSCTRCTRLSDQCSYGSSPLNESAASLARSHGRTLQFLEELVNADPDELGEALRKRVRRHLKAEPKPEMEIGTASPTGRSVVATEDQARFDESRNARDTATDLVVTDLVGDESVSRENDILLQMSLNEQGQLGHYGATSLVWQSPPVSFPKPLERLAVPPLPSGSRSAQEDTTFQDPLVGTQGRYGLANNDHRIDSSYRSIDSYTQTWETIATKRIQLEYGESTSNMINHLLKVFFTWQRIHATVHRPVFIRDMALDGPYFNRFLLHAICAQATRYSDFIHSWPSGNERSTDGTHRLDASIDFFTAAKSLLSEEMDKASSIPTIQGLLLLGQRECGRGNLSQGWQYTGMALSAIRDMGIHLNPARLSAFGGARISQEDVEMRQRVFWSAFTWDKTISLALGRTPNLLSTQHELPDPSVDQTEDNDEWAPYWTHPPQVIQPVLASKSWTSLTFRHFVALCKIFQSIIMSLYSFPPFRAAGQSRFIERTKQRLSEWFDHLPSQIKLDVGDLPSYCPPPHILNVNVLYRAAWILLYRLFLPDAPSAHPPRPSDRTSEAANVCTKMSKELHNLFCLHKRSFDSRNLPYTMCWAMYSAATVDALDFHSPDPVRSAAASERLGLTLHVLEKGSLQNTVIKRSVEIIRQRLRAPAVYHRHDNSASSLSLDPETVQRPGTSLSATAQSSMLSHSRGEAAASLSHGNDAEMLSAPVIDAEEGNQGAPSDNIEFWNLYGQLLDAGSNADFLQGMLAMPAVPQPGSETEWTGQAVFDQESLP